MTVELVAAGSVSDYDNDTQADIAAEIAALAGVSPDQVTLSVLPASVLILATITPDAQSDGGGAAQPSQQAAACGAHDMPHLG